MPCHHLVTTLDVGLGAPVASLAGSRWPTGRLVHLLGMDANPSRRATDTARHQDSLEPVLTLSEVAVRLCVSVQTLYDLRSQSRHGVLAGAS